LQISLVRGILRSCGAEVKARRTGLLEKEYEMKVEAKLNAIEACRRLGISLDALYRLIYAAKVPAEKHDGHWQVPAFAIEARLKSREAKHGGKQ
jgi:hypothetical protein